MLKKQLRMSIELIIARKAELKEAAKLKSTLRIWNSNFIENWCKSKILTFSYYFFGSRSQLAWNELLLIIFILKLCCVTVIDTFDCFQFPVILLSYIIRATLPIRIQSCGQRCLLRALDICCMSLPDIIIFQQVQPS